MHVCGSHEQAIARFGLRTTFPKALNVIMGPGCPVCITDMPEVDEGVAPSGPCGGGLGLGLADIGGSENRLALEVGCFDDIAVD